MKQIRNLWYILILLLISGCSQLEKAEDLISGLSEKEKYQRERDISNELFSLWESRIQKALNDSIEVEMPYTEAGNLKPKSFSIYSYQAYLKPGEILNTNFKTDSSSTLIFTEIYRRNKETKKFEQVLKPKSDGSISYEVEENGLYKVIFQPEIEAHTPFTIQLSILPAYQFPVSGGENADIGSYWGDIRDGGRRDHEGIDIFADRGTPVIATTSGRVGFSGEKGLGGKQVWLRDSKRSQSLYYAHLDSIVPNLNLVKTGDTLGFVGNTGNAKTTPPHLHFGIYRRNTGAIDPLGFVYKTETLEESIPKENEIAQQLRVNSTKANLRNKAAASNSKIMKTARNGELLFVQGKTADWYHVRDSLDRSMYVHESLVSPNS
ncbi:peptidoglycan DD-metalloendopeptidase family protein [Christiangramia sp. LLG6405-1]|uniref:peptidoglycan DD-metalloendopeptidase family protein n=1 Tax=Christiangramia sp. LLG6405-1 TaxID=3160832 RepID=UPI00386F9DDB